MSMGEDRIHGGDDVTQAPAHSPPHYHNHRSCKAIKNKRGGCYSGKLNLSCHFNKPQYMFGSL